MRRAGLGAHRFRPAADQLPHDPRLDLAAHPGRHGARRRARQQDRAHEPHQHRRDRARLQRRARTCASARVVSTRTCGRPATYVNRTRTGTTPIPPIATRYGRVDAAALASHLRFAHRDLARPPHPLDGDVTARRSCATTPERSTRSIRAGRSRSATTRRPSRCTARSQWIPGPSAWPWVAFMGVLFALGVAGRAAAGCRGDRRGRRARRRRHGAHDQRGGRARGHAAGEDGAVLRRQLRVGDRVGRGRAHDLGARPSARRGDVRSPPRGRRWSRS